MCIFSIFAPVKYPVPVDAGVKPFRGWGYPPNPLLWGSLYMCIFLSASDDAKKCAPKPALIHWKSAGFPAYFFTSGKARLPKPKLSELLAYYLTPSGLSRHFGNCVLRRSGRSLKKRGRFRPLVVLVTTIQARFGFHYSATNCPTHTSHTRTRLRLFTP